MCGFVGSNFLNREEITQLNNLLHHRGPDQEGIYIDNNISLGHKRLSILDLSNDGKQPMKDESGKYIIVYNGEIYNFKEIKEELIN